jgi:hypothetical protein
LCTYLEASRCAERNRLDMGRREACLSYSADMNEGCVCFVKKGRSWRAGMTPTDGSDQMDFFEEKKVMRKVLFVWNREIVVVDI